MVILNSQPRYILQEKPLFEKDAEITVELVNQKIAELSSIRGRRGANRQKNIETFELLCDFCVSEKLGAYSNLQKFIIICLIHNQFSSSYQS